MILVKPSIQFLWMTEEPLLQIERSGRTCYKSEKGISEGSAKLFVQKLLDKGHHAMIEHASASYRVICDRGVTHEIVRHRLFSYAQESTRYCNYKGGVTFIIPPWIIIEEEFIGVDTGWQRIQQQMVTHGESNCNVRNDSAIWLNAIQDSEWRYCELLSEHWSPQQARSVLPNSLKTEIVITGNLREWRHFFKLRTAKTAHPQMQEVADMLLKDIQKRIPILFEGFDNEHKTY